MRGSSPPILQSGGGGGGGGPPRCGGRCPMSGHQRVWAPPSGVYSAGRLQWRFACTFGFGHGSVVAIGGRFCGPGWEGGYWWFLWKQWVFFGLGVALSGLWGGRLCVPGLILLVGFGGAVLVVSVLGIVCDYYWRPFLPKSRARAPHFKVYHAGKLQWHFTCGFDFRHEGVKFKFWLKILINFQ